MNRCIINVAFGPRCVGAQRRLVQRLNDVGDATSRVFWTESLPPDSPGHKDVPFAFKPFAFEAARKMGYDEVLWLDSTMVALKPLDRIWELLARDDVFLWDSGWWTSQWTSDACLKEMGVTREAASKWPMIQASVIGLRLSSARGDAFQRSWMAHAQNGTAFRGPARNFACEASQDSACMGHRWDQSVGSVIAAQQGLPMHPYPLCCYSEPTAESVLQNLGFVP